MQLGLLVSRKNNHARLARLLIGFCLLFIYSLGQFVLSPSTLGLLAAASTEHKVILSGDRVILHHEGTASTEHHGLDQIITVFSHTDESGDHVLPLAELNPCEEPRAKEFTVYASSESSHSDGDDLLLQQRFLAQKHSQDADSQQENSWHKAELTLTQWRTVKLMV